MLSTLSPHPAAELALPRFLIIDDDEVDRIKCQRTLRHGFGGSTQIDMAGGWEEAINTIERRAHDIYLVDHNLSGGTGLDLIRRYREAMQDSIFILFTGQDNRDIDIAAAEAGASDYILKSEITSSRLERAVRYALAMNTQKQQLLDMTRALEKANAEALRTANELETTQVELRKALLQANASEMQKRLVLDALPIAVAYIDRRKRYTLVNKLACEWYRRTEAEFVGHSVADLHGGEYALLEDVLDTVLKDQTVIVEKLIRYPDAVSRDVKIYAAPNIGPDGAVLGWYTMSEDISERRKLDNLKKEFITTVSHELRTPLTSLNGSISLMRNSLRKDDSSNPEQLVEIAHRNCQRLMELVNDLLDMERIETEDVEIDLEPLSVPDLIREGIELNAAYGKRFGVRFDVCDDIPDLMVSGNFQALMQVMANLLSNAAKHSPSGGRVAITAHRTDQQVEIAVRDWGCGIPEKYHDVIFEKFVKIDSLNANQVPGTGLGLSICRKIVNQHNGELGFRSKSGEGSTFFFTLPVRVA